MYKFALMTSLAVLLAGCVETSGAAGPVEITTEAQFRESIVGRQLSFEGNTFTVNADGTLSGPWDGSGLTGNWSWQSGAFCRTVAIGGIDRGRDCQTWVVNGRTATVTRDRGNGSSFTYRIG